MNKTMTRAEYFAEAERRFGPDRMAWRFVCPSCRHSQSVADYKAAGAPESAVAFSCVGRWLPERRDAFAPKGAPGPCNYAGGGLFKIAPIRLSDAPDSGPYFALAAADAPATLLNVETKEPDL